MRKVSDSYAIYFTLKQCQNDIQTKKKKGQQCSNKKSMTAFFCRLHNVKLLFIGTDYHLSVKVLTTR